MLGRKAELRTIVGGEGVSYDLFAPRVLPSSDVI